jgi:hypothetical protein
MRAMFPELLAIGAVALVMIAVAMMIQLDRVSDHRASPDVALEVRPRLHGFRAQRRAPREKASPALFLLGAVFMLLVLAGVA